MWNDGCDKKKEHWKIKRHLIIHNASKAITATQVTLYLRIKFKITLKLLRFHGRRRFRNSQSSDFFISALSYFSLPIAVTKVAQRRRTFLE